jgi:hypothetical protein
MSSGQTLPLAIGFRSLSLPASLVAWSMAPVLIFCRR